MRRVLIHMPSAFQYSILMEDNSDRVVSYSLVFIHASSISQSAVIDRRLLLCNFSSHCSSEMPKRASTDSNQHFSSLRGWLVGVTMIFFVPHALISDGGGSCWRIDVRAWSKGSRRRSFCLLILCKIRSWRDLWTDK